MWIQIVTRGQQFLYGITSFPSQDLWEATIFRHFGLETTVNIVCLKFAKPISLQKYDVIFHELTNLKQE